VFSDRPIGADAPAIRHLQSLQRQLEAHLGVRPDSSAEPIEVYILNDRQAFDHFLKFYYPELPPRRAFFLAQGTKRVVYAYANDRLEEDLRHEATHALLHASVADLPLWLDEGLAEFFEVPEEQAGLNREHLSRLPQDIAERWVPDLEHLEALNDVRKMSPRDYRESWLWVHFLLNGSPVGKTALLSYLGDLHANPAAALLSSRISAEGADASAQLLAHLSRLRDEPIAKTEPAGNVVRLQDAGASASGKTSARGRGLIGRILGLLGL
jgi:hypothetical protein